MTTSRTTSLSTLESLSTIRPSSRQTQPCRLEQYSHPLLQLWLKRADQESIYSKLPKLVKDLHIVVQDWVTSKIPEAKDIKELSNIQLKTAFEFLSRGRVIICDRLHGHIPSVLLGKPNVILDNSYKKTSSFQSTWTPSVENVLFASSEEDAIKKAQYLLHKYY